MMRPLLPADPDLAARVLLALPSETRRAEMDDMLAVAARAERYRKLTGRLDPEGGEGSLLSAALMRSRSPSLIAGLEYRRCLSIVLERLETGFGTIADCDETNHVYMLERERWAR